MLVIGCQCLPSVGQRGVACPGPWISQMNASRSSVNRVRHLDCKCVFRDGNFPWSYYPRPTAAGKGISGSTRVRASGTSKVVPAITSPASSVRCRKVGYYTFLEPISCSFRALQCLILSRKFQILCSHGNCHYASSEWKRMARPK